MTFPLIIPARHLETSPEMALHYAKLTQDFNALHLDAEFAATTPFKRPIAHGTMAMNLVLSALEAASPAHDVAEIELRFTAPTPVGARLSTRVELQDAEQGIYEIAAELGTGEVVLRGTARLTLRAAD